LNLTSNTNKQREKQRNAWIAVIAITLGALSLVITEFLPVGIIPDIAAGLNVSEGKAGLSLTSTAILGMIAAPLATIGIGKIDRRKILLLLTFILILSNALSVIANNFAVFMVARIILGIGVGGFWAISIAAATSLVPKEHAARASSLVFSGISIGSVISVPAGAYLGSYFDWKASFIAASILSIVVFVIQFLLIPKIPIEQGTTLKDFTNLLRSWKIRSILFALILTIGGQYSAYTYLTPFLQQVTGVNSNLLTVLLFVYGIIGIIGNFLGGLFSERNLSQAIVTTSIILFLSLLTMTLLGDIQVVAIIGLVIWALAFGMAPICIQLWLSSVANSPEVGQAHYTTVYQFSISFGSLIGGLAVDHMNITSSMALGSVLTFGTLILVSSILFRNKQAKVTVK